MRKSVVKIIGIAATVIGMGATLIVDWADEKKMEEKIEERINEVLNQKTDNEES